MIYGIFLSYGSKKSFLNAHHLLSVSPWKFETFTPYEVEEILVPSKNTVRNSVKVAALVGAIAGMLMGFFMQWIADVENSPMNIGGRPLNSWPAFVPVTWEMTVLFSGVSLFLALWWRIGLPRPYHPVFNAKSYSLETDHFGILILPTHEGRILPESEFLSSLHADSFEEVPW
jgi:hypothetical protein